MSSVSCNTLRGHTDSVESVFKSDTGELFSSSCDGTVRMWDVRSKHSSVRLFKIPRNTDADVGICKQSNNLLCVSRGSSLFGYDLRGSDSVIVSGTDFSYSRLDVDDEINDFCFTTAGTHLLVPSDSGAVSLVDARTFVEESSTPAHDNIASVARCLSSHSVSGGYDCNLVSFSNASSVKKIISMCDLVPQEDTPGQTVNPPFVTSMELLTSLAVGLGDGSVVVLEVRKGKVNGRQIAWGGICIHSSAVAALTWDPTHSSVWSVGNDSVLINMNETKIAVRFPLSFKPNSLALLRPGCVAAAGLSPDIHILDFS